ncbi:MULTISPECIES: response regulator [unclassified Tolypothrix]|uniref:response regulator n=1 Tax=unclassified Tolypothrix TaxID=2649714 RepID=UPI0005EABA90|nr:MULTISPECIES: response regulator [unclassified Tolypothrix]BAY94866.1 response regulator receiver domain protein [Microchaete diplosiphon NIES-3275]EKF00905.1 response regulator [Tolypothrix sp. PCC 7601]MBE9087581.1 response regulator [Tolypothrix sp. LEGE 11397]UYD28512.1 response regulator [Tolypothrix sp. PCC 7712]UYD35575.1 response regulator [Tolypothrix sp. PCC 7601]
MGITWAGKILIVKDSLREWELMSYYLGDWGYKIVKASAAKEALEIALEEKPDAIVTNVVMPGMSGFELCRFLKINLSSQKMPIVICSNKNQAVHHAWARKQGADVYLTKPYTPEDLLSAIKVVTGWNYIIS